MFGNTPIYMRIDKFHRKSWSIQRSWQKRERLGKKEVIGRARLALGATQNSTRNAALIALTYLTAARATEILNLKISNISHEIKAGRECIIITIPNKKHRNKKFKSIPIALDYESDAELLKMARPYMEQMQDRGISDRAQLLLNLPPDELSEDEEEYLNSELRLFNMTYGAFYYNIRKFTGLNPHYLRHLRLTELATSNQMKPFSLQRIAGWTDLKPAQRYLELNVADIAADMPK